MRRAVNRQAVAELYTMPAPTGGWNTRDPIAQMPVGDAVRLTNLIPDTDGVRLRDGYEQFVTTGSTPVDFLRSFQTSYGPRFIAASSGTLYDITSGSATTIKAGFFRDDWNDATMNGRLGMVNGGDDPIYLDYSPALGVVRHNLTLTGPAIPALMRVIQVFKSRSYFATSEEPAFWYSAVGALGGTLTRFPIDRVSATGGNVINLSSWTVDGGSGPDDYFVLFLDTGEVIVYQGDNPGDSSSWGLVGRYSAGKIISSVSFAGQIHAVTDFDYNIFPRDFQTHGIKDPTKLSGAATAAVRQKGGLTRWQVMFVPNRGLKIINVPQSESVIYQHVTNLKSGGHCLFTGLNAARWELHKGELYFGGMSGAVNRISGTSDAGTAITWEMVTAPDRMGLQSEKNILEYRTVITGQGALTESTGIGYDYNSPEFVQSMTTEAIGTPWNTSPWDTSEWSPEPQTKAEWFTGTGSGQAVQFYSRGSVKGFTPTWHSIDFLYEPSDVH